MAKSRGFAAIAMLTVGLGIGANATLLCVLDAVVLKPLPYEEPHRLVVIWEELPGGRFSQMPLSGPDFLDLREQAGSFQALAAFEILPTTLTGRGEPVELPGAAVSPALFPLLGVGAELGRTFLPDEEAGLGEPVALLSHVLWSQRFGADPDILHRTIYLDGEPYVVVGVLPASFAFPPPMSWEGKAYSPRTGSEVFVPLVFDQTRRRRDQHTLLTLGRLEPGVTFQEAREELGSVLERLAAAHPDTNPPQLGGQLSPLHDQAVRHLLPALRTLLGAVAVLLVMCCANTAHLLLARDAVRAHELAIRCALGASRWRLVRQLLAESLGLALGSGLVGALLTWPAVRLVASLEIDGLPRLEEAAVDGGTLGFVLLLCLTSALLFGLVPALRILGMEPGGTLREIGRSLRPGPAHRRLQDGLVVSQVALAATLLVTAGLLLKSFSRLEQVDPGFETDGVSAVELSLPQSRYASTQLASAVGDLLRRLRALPEVEEAGAASSLPLSGEVEGGGFSVEGGIPLDAAEVPIAARHRVTSGYLEVLGIPILEGRGFGDSDNDASPRVALVNESLARRYWGDVETVGRRLTFDNPESPDATWCTVVGVVGDVRDRRLDRRAGATVYLPFTQAPTRSFSLVLRSSDSPSALRGPVREAVHGEDPQLPVSLEAMARHLEAELVRPRLSSLLLAVFAAASILLGAVGIYAVMSFAVSQRAEELAVRIAIGAQRHQVSTLVLAHALCLTLLGLGVGCAAAIVVGRMLSGVLYGVRALDAAVLGRVAALLVLVALAASGLPAWRAARVEPMSTLHAE